MELRLYVSTLVCFSTTSRLGTDPIYDRLFGEVRAAKGIFVEKKSIASRKGSALSDIVTVDDGTASNQLEMNFRLTLCHFQQRHLRAETR